MAEVEDKRLLVELIFDELLLELEVFNDTLREGVELGLVETLVEEVLLLMLDEDVLLLMLDDEVCFELTRDETILVLIELFLVLVDNLELVELFLTLVDNLELVELFLILLDVVLPVAQLQSLISCCAEYLTKEEVFRGLD